MHLRTLAVSGVVVFAAAFGIAAPVSAATAGPAASGGGSSTALSLAASPHTIDFGGVQIGTTSAPQTLTVTNTGSVDADLIEFDAPFQVAFIDYSISNDCPQAGLAPGASCTASITFHPAPLDSPKADGPQDIELEVLGLAAGSPGPLEPAAVVKVDGRATSGQGQ